MTLRGTVRVLVLNPVALIVVVAASGGLARLAGGQGLPDVIDRAKRRGGHASVHSVEVGGTVVERVVPRRTA